MSNCLNLKIMFLSPKQGLARIETFFFKVPTTMNWLCEGKVKAYRKKSCFSLWSSTMNYLSIFTSCNQAMLHPSSYIM